VEQAEGGTCKTRWEKIKEWLPPKERTVETGLTIVLAAMVGIYFKYTDSERLKEINRLQKEMSDVVHTKSESAIAAELLYYLSCTTPPEIRSSAIALLRDAAATDADRRLRLAIVACDNTPAPQSGNPKDLVNSLIEGANDRIFVTEVMYGRRFYKDRLWEDAARQWYKAMADLPQVYLDSGKIDWNQVNQARTAYEAEHYVAAADLYAHTFRNVATGE
jgi:hypothetical protein